MSTDHDDTTTTDEQATTADTADTMGKDPDSESGPDAAADGRQWLAGDIERKLRYFAIAALALLALIALFQFYTAASATINRLIAREYQPLFQALFNLTILLLSGAGILWQADQLR